MQEFPLEDESGEYEPRRFQKYCLRGLVLYCMNSIPYVHTDSHVLTVNSVKDISGISFKGEDIP
jgi:hypothetical protein